VQCVERVGVWSGKRSAVKRGPRCCWHGREENVSSRRDSNNWGCGVGLVAKFGSLPVNTSILKTTETMTSTSDDDKDEDGFSEVGQKSKTTMQTLIDTKKHRFGIQFSKLQQRNQRGVHPDDFPAALFKLLAAVDKSTVVLPHNNDIKKAKGVVSIMKGKDFEAMLDLITERWGSPSDNQSRLAFSLYIASSIISPDMKTL
jgi:hypothetical protein